jgi:hypothetical protein
VSVVGKKKGLAFTHGIIPMGLCYFWLGISSDGVVGIDIRAVFFDASGADALVE